MNCLKSHDSTLAASNSESRLIRSPWQYRDDGAIGPELVMKAGGGQRRDEQNYLIIPDIRMHLDGILRPEST